MKTENSKATSGNEETRCHYQAQLIFLGSCPMGLNSLYSKGWFQLTCCEYPKWVTAVNSMSAICCPLGHFWTAAELQCQLLTGNMAGLTQFQKGERSREREGEDERENTHASSQKKTDNSVFFLHWSWWKCIWRRMLNPICHLLCFVFYYFTHEVGLGFYIEIIRWGGNLQPVRCHSIPTFLDIFIILFFQTQKWIFPLL